MSKGVELIQAERERQVADEGYTAEHDAGHAHDLIRAARAYAFEARVGVAVIDTDIEHLPGPASSEWPWASWFWKPTGDPVRDLTKAGALIAAAIDSLTTDHTDGGL